jgi:hypothetical protein
MTPPEATPNESDAEIHGQRMRKRVTFLVVGTAAVLGLGLLLENRLHTLAPVSWAVAVIGVGSFFWLLYLLPSEKDITKSSMRNAITGSFIVVHFVLLALFAFWHGGTDKIPPMTDRLISNFTTLMGVVIAFHFGTSAYEKVSQIKAVAGNPDAASAIKTAAQATE